MVQQNLEQRQDLFGIFQDNPKTKYPIYLKIIVRIMRLIDTGINLIQAWQIIFVDSKYILYTKEQAKGRITRIGQINYIIAYFLIYYDIKIEKKIKRRHHK